ncbi:MAG: polymer-forming cytoskeletal protein [Rickettsiales bacterium]|jgi:cytoskeletal protein CcmA (bactofilin family)|nr:polymer-forming cytoskeletal protein [Rickettsiales bacterium]
MSLIKNFTKDVTPSLIAKGVTVLGDIKDGNYIEIEGVIEGNILATVVTIREEGQISGNIKCAVLNIKGNFKGIASCEKINISDTAVVNGTLEYKFLAVDYGANINCELKRISEEKAQKLQEQTTEK